MQPINNYREFLFECDYYDEWDDKEIHTCALVMAPTMHEAVEAIERRLPYCHNLHITEYDENQFVWMSQEHYNRLSNQDEPFMFDNDEEEEYPQVIIEKCGMDDEDDDDYKIDFSNGVPVSEEEDNYWDELFKRTIERMSDPEEDDD